MKKALLLVLSLLPLTVLGQSLKCCESVEDVEAYLSGTWRTKNAYSKRVYTYWFDKGKGYWNEKERSEKRNEYFTSDDYPFNYTLSNGQVYSVNINYQYGNWIGDLKFLSAKKMVLVSNGKETEYSKETQ